MSLCLIVVVTFLTADFSLSSRTSASILQQSNNQHQPLSLEKLKRLISNKASSEKDEKAKDIAIATEIRKSRLSFKLDSHIYKYLVDLGAGPNVAKALQELLTKDGTSKLEPAGDKMIIVVADFKGPENYGVSEILIEKLREATAVYSDIKVQALGKAITIQEGSEVAISEGKRLDASIVIWGWYVTQNKVTITAHFEILKKPFLLSLLGSKESLRLPIEQLKEFIVQTIVSSDMTYLTLLTVGLARFETEDYVNAVSLFTKAQEQSPPEQMIRPADLYFFRGLAYFYDSSGFCRDYWDKAIDDFSKVIELRPRDIIAHYYRGKAYLYKQDLDKAINDFNKIIEFEPNNFIGYQLRSIVLTWKGILKQALVDQKRFTNLIKSKPQAHSGLNNDLLRVELGPDYQNAANSTKLRKLKPEEISLYRLLWSRALAYWARDRYEEAIAVLGRAIHLKPNYASLYLLLGMIYLDADSHREAIKAFNKALELDSKCLIIYWGRAFAYEANEEFGRALDDYTQYIKLKINNIDPDIYLSRAKLYAEKLLLDQAINDYNEYIKSVPDDLDVYLNRASLYKRKGDLDHAVADYSKAIELRPDMANLYLLRGEAYAEKSDRDNAISDANKVFDLTRDPKILKEARSLLEQLKIK